MARAAGMLSNPSDEQLMWRVRAQDDSGAFAEVMRRWEAPIRRLCARMLGDAHRGEDLAQETFVRVYTRRKEYQPQGRFSSFLWRVALNLCYDELRRLQRRNESPLEGEDELPAPNEITPDVALDQQEQAEIVRRALMRLPDSLRIVVILKHYERLKFREIAELLEIPEGTVKSRMAEAISQLSRKLARSRPSGSSAPVNPRTVEDPCIL